MDNICVNSITEEPKRISYDGFEIAIVLLCGPINKYDISNALTNTDHSLFGVRLHNEVEVCNFGDFGPKRLIFRH